VRRLSALFALVAVTGCGDAPPKDAKSAQDVGVAVPSATTAAHDPDRTRPPEPAGTTAGTVAPPAPAAPKRVYPPARPATIALVSGAADPSPEQRAVDAELKKGDEASEKGDLPAATKAYQAAQKLAPKKAAPLVGLARTKIAAVDLPMDFAVGKGNKVIADAARDLKRALDMEPELGPAQVEYGRALLLLGDADKALAALKEGARLMPQEAEAQSALGVALLALGKGDEAVPPMTRAAELDPGSAARHGNLGTVLLMRGRVRDAIGEYEVQVALADGDPRAHSDLGTALLAQNEVERAIGELRRAIALDPKRATFHSNLGYAFQAKGQLKEAIAEYEAALKIDSKLVSAWINLATALSKDPTTRKKARDALETAKRLDPSDPRVRANLDELDALEKLQK
jgi:Flp pilus assembly protein TadD